MKKLFKTIQNIPGFKISIIFKKLPRLIAEKNSRKMGYKLGKRLLEQSIVRMIKIAANINQ